MALPWIIIILVFHTIWDGPVLCYLEFPLITLSPLKRRLLYAVVFEILAVILSTIILMFLSGSGVQESLPLAIVVSGVAVLWNYLYNTLFESWERRQQIMARTLRIRTLHTLGFERGLLIFCLPIYMYWFSVGPWEAFLMETTLVVFFLVYTFVFTFIFDKIFTLQHQNPYADVTL